MAKRSYLARLEGDQSKGYGVTFPDLPGCVSFGMTLDQASAGADEALSLHLEGMAEDGEAFPEPSHAGDLMALEPAAAGTVTWYLASAETPDASERVNVYLPRNLLQRIDRYATETGMNRSSFFGLAAKTYLTAESSHKAGKIGNPGGGTK